jgi:hypothetical protein
MTSRLSSLLVRDGLVTVKRMERAFQRQVLDGGALDTILLELGLIPEERLLQYLALASGLPPVGPDDVAHGGAAAARCPREQAVSYRVVPLGLEGDALRVLTHDPVDLAALEALADELGIAVQPLVAPEYRFRLAFQQTFGGALDERFARLAAQPGRGTAAPVGRAPSVVVDAGDAAEPTAAPSPRRTRPMSVDTLRERRAERGESPPPPAPAPTATTTAPAPAPVVRQVEMTARPGTEPAVAPTDVSPLSIGEARAAFAAATRRDEVFELLLRVVRGRTWYAGLLTVQAGAAIGRLAIMGDDAERDAIARVLIPLDTPSAFNKATATGAPYIGPIASGDAEIDGMIKRMGGVVPSAAVLMPIALRGRVVALVLGHRGADALNVSEVSELLPLAGMASDALARIIVKGKGGKGEALGTAPTVEAPAQVPPSEAAVAPTPTPAPAVAPPAAAPPAPPAPIAELFATDAAVRDAAIAELRARPPGEVDLAPVRAALVESDLPRAQAAAAVLAALGDVASLPALLDLLARGGALAPAATAALIRLAKQDHGNSAKKWRQWWDRNKSKHVIEWMLEGLGHKDPEIRRISIDDLRALTGEYFGFHHDLAKREREEARQRWLLWWAETGRRRFLRSTTARAATVQSEL